MDIPTHHLNLALQPHPMSNRTPTEATAMTDDLQPERKMSIAHDEHPMDQKEAVDADATSPPVSAFRDLTQGEVVRTFWKTTLFCQMALFIACADGFQYTLPGNLIAQTSFVGRSLFEDRTGMAQDSPPQNSLAARSWMASLPSMPKTSLPGVASTLAPTFLPFCLVVGTFFTPVASCKNVPKTTNLQNLPTFADVPGPLTTSAAVPPCSLLRCL